MNKKMLSYLTAGMLLLGSCAGLGTWWCKSTQASEQPTNQKLAYTASIKADNQQDKQDQTNSNEGEDQESASLKALAKITPEQARAQALKAVNGTVKTISLDNENGNLVYSAEVQTAGGVVDVKVDAGNGKVLAQDSGEDKEGSHENDREESTHEPDNDNIQLEQ